MPFCCWTVLLQGSKGVNPVTEAGPEKWKSALFINCCQPTVSFQPCMSASFECHDWYDNFMMNLCLLTCPLSCQPWRTPRRAGGLILWIAGWIPTSMWLLVNRRRNWLEVRLDRWTSWTMGHGLILLLCELWNRGGMREFHFFYTIFHEFLFSVTLHYSTAPQSQTKAACDFIDSIWQSPGLSLSSLHSTGSLKISIRCSFRATAKACVTVTLFESRLILGVWGSIFAILGKSKEACEEMTTMLLSLMGQVII